MDGEFYFDDWLDEVMDMSLPVSLKKNIKEREREEAERDIKEKMKPGNSKVMDEEDMKLQNVVEQAQEKHNLPESLFVPETLDITIPETLLEENDEK